MRLIRLAVILTLSLILAPPATEAQTAGKVWRIGFLSPFSSEYDTSRRVAFQQGLRDLGYVEGKHVVIEQRHAEGQLGRLADFTTTTFTPERFADYLASKSSDTTEIESRRAELEHLVAVVIPGLPPVRGEPSPTRSAQTRRFRALVSGEST